MIPLPIKQLSSWMKVSLYGLLLTGLYYSTFIQMRRRWRLPEYNYCYLIPFVVLYLIWDRRDRFAAIPPEHSWKGLIPLGFGLLFFWLGELGAEYFTLYLSSWLVLIGICWMHLGWKKLKTIGFALSFILTMFPELFDFSGSFVLVDCLLFQSPFMEAVRRGNLLCASGYFYKQPAHRHYSCPSQIFRTRNSTGIFSRVFRSGHILNLRPHSADRDKDFG
jgi:hypothetical protein